MEDDLVAVNLAISVDVLQQNCTPFEAIGSVKFNRRYFKRVHLYARSRIVQARVVSRCTVNIGRVSVVCIYIGRFSNLMALRQRKIPNSKKRPCHVCAKLFNRCLFYNLTIDNNDTLFVDQSENERIKLENDELIILNFCKYYEFLLKILFRRNFIEYFKFYRV